MTKKQIIEHIRQHLQMATNAKDYYLEKYKNDVTNDYNFTQFTTWSTVCNTLNGILRSIK